MRILLRLMSCSRDVISRARQQLLSRDVISRARQQLLFQRIALPCSTSNLRFYSNVNNGSAAKYIPRRSVLYVPGNDERKINKVTSLDVDCIVLDCEDGVAMNRKEEARNTIAGCLRKLTDCKADICVRVNSVSSGLMEDDLKAVFQSSHLPQTIMLPKVNTPEEVHRFTKRLKEIMTEEQKQKKFGLIVMLESAVALMNINQIFSKTVALGRSETLYNLEGVVFGSDDFCADIGATRTNEASELIYARQKVVTYAKAWRLQVIDLVYIDYKDLAGLKRQAEEGARMGFTGKQVIHPEQVPVVNAAFSPTQAKVQWAKDMIQAFDEHQKHGKGAFVFDGKMIDMPLVLQARNIVQMAQAIKIPVT